MKKSFFSKAVAGIMAGMLALSLAVSAVSFGSAIHAEAQGEVLAGKSAMEITELMGKGYNIGNTLDATGGSMSDINAHETSWGNPAINKELMHGIKAAGFKSVRIPITWSKHIDINNNFAITEEFKARVREVVDMAYEEGLFVIINVHHESWVNRKDIDTAYVEIGKELAAVWSQVSDIFADYDQHLIFEGMNEPRAEGTGHEWNGYDACYDAVAYLDKLFVETVRGNGKGYNGERMLMIPGYAASSNPQVLKSIVIPETNGVKDENVAVSVHCYSPYNFCLSDAQTTFNPNNSGDTSDIKSLMTNLKAYFLDKGTAVVIGECGCTNSGNNNDARLAWFTYFGNITSDYGIPAIVWDNGAGGSSGGECHKYINRKTGESLSQDLIDAFVGKGGALGDTIIDFESIVQDGTTTLIIPFDIGFTSSILSTQFKVNHTDDKSIGFALKVAPEDNCEASLNISKYEEIPVRVTAWIKSDEATTVSIGTSGSVEGELVQTDVGTEWTRVSAVVTPGAGKTYLYFKGSDKTFYVDDIKISMDVTDEAEGADNSAVTDAGSDAGENTSGEGNTEGNIATGAQSGGASSADTAKTEGGVSPLVVVLIICGVVAVGAIAVIIVGSRKKNNK